MTTLQDIIEQIATKLSINSNLLIGILDRKGIDKGQLVDNILLTKIGGLINADEGINNFETKIKKEDVKANYGQLKQSLGKLQTLILIKKLEKAEDCSDVLNSLIIVLNQKVSAVNNILEEQKGGSKQNKFINKYYKYKTKYLELKYNFLV